MTDDEFILRVQRDVVDSYDEELELEREDRPFDAQVPHELFIPEKY